jgi:hypothetical protein
MKLKNLKVNYIIIFTLFILVTFLVVNSTSGFTNQESYDIVIIAGQSNAVGFGTRNHSSKTKFGATSSEDLPDSNIKMYCKDGNIRNAVHPFDHLYDWNSKKYRAPISGSSSSDNCNEVGFGLTFSKEYLKSAKKVNSKVLLVGCAYGGTSFSKPQRLNSSNGIWWRTTDDPNYLFTDTNIRGSVRSLYLWTKEKITNMKAKVGPNSKVVAILWHQGEGDTDFCMTNRTNKNLYISYINTLFASLRTDIRTLFPNSTSVPILLGGLSPELIRKRDKNHSFRPGMNSTSGMTYFIQNSVVPSIQNAYFVPSDPIPNSKFTDYLEGDNEVNSAGDTTKENRSHVHFSASSQREFGKRYAYILNRIL